ncbi:uncharacterized protein LOC121550039 [Coregonus clupeaformis]|uniref:uncharacterized protein LOC121550039 n=1 Tax=Coregonus clupeaformis TaxID=59861 RepID=UPI001BE0C7C0|nr:uncharacterized protein LOC121550039 [Coregonus clupeaformis]
MDLDQTEPVDHLGQHLSSAPPNKPITNSQCVHRGRDIPINRNHAVTAQTQPEMASSSPTQTTVTDLVCHAPVPGDDQSKHSVQHVLLRELLYMSDEIAHLRQVSHCLAEYERTLSRLELENAQLRNMESDLLESAEVSERGLRLARESRRHKDQEIHDLREANWVLALTNDRLKEACREKDRCLVDCQTKWSRKPGGMLPFAEEGERRTLLGHGNKGGEGSEESVEEKGSLHEKKELYSNSIADYSLHLHLKGSGGDPCFEMQLPLSSEGPGVAQVCLLLRQLETEVHSPGKTDAGRNQAIWNFGASLGKLHKTLKGGEIDDEVEYGIDDDQKGAPCTKDSMEEEAEALEEAEFIEEDFVEVCRPIHSSIIPPIIHFSK